jgi:phosphomethylpyrimidine synthase
MSKSNAQKISAVSFSVTTGALPASRKIYVQGERHTSVKVPMREIELSKQSGEPNFTVYDPSGIYTDDKATIDIHKGLPKLRQGWIANRGDVEMVPARKVKPEDNGLKVTAVSEVETFPNVNKTPLRAKSGKAPTQLAYARKGIITPEMFGAKIPESSRRNSCAKKSPRAAPSFPPTSTTRNSSR